MIHSNSESWNVYFRIGGISAFLVLFDFCSYRWYFSSYLVWDDRL